MSARTESRNGALAMLGGLLTCVALGLDDLAPAVVWVAVLVPVLLGFGVLEVFRRHRAEYGTVGRGGVALSSLGLAFLLVAIVLYVVIPPGLVAVILVAVPGITGIVSLAVGSGLLAVTLSRLDVIRRPTAVLLGTGVVLAPIASALFGLLPDVVGGQFSIIGSLGGMPYGIGWILTGNRLRESTRPTRSVSAGLDRDLSPNLVTAALVGCLFFLVSVGRFIPLGPLSGTPWVNQSLVLDVGHLVSGLVGVTVAASRDARLATRYNQLLGVLLGLLGVVAFIGVFLDLRMLRWLLVGVLQLNMPDVILHLPAGVLSLTTGFLAPEIDRHPAAADSSPA